MHDIESLVADGRQRVGQPAVLAANGGRRWPGSRAAGVAFQGDIEREVQDDRHRWTPMPARHGEQPCSGPILDVGRIHDGEPATPQPHGQDAMEQVEGILGRGLGVRVVGDEGA